MKKYIIKDFIQSGGLLEDVPLYYTRYTTSHGSWTISKSQATTFDTEEEAIEKIEQLLKEDGSEYQIISIYTNNR
jgi:hypothetical protein